MSFNSTNSFLMLDKSTNEVPPITSLPKVFRIESIVGKPRSSKGMGYEAVLFHEGVSLKVAFSLGYPEIRYKPDQLVSVRWKHPTTSINGCIQIARLVILERVEKGLNPFDTVPYSWVKNREMVKQAREFFKALPDSLQHLVLAVLWNGKRFRKFCESPASLNNHHNRSNGLLVHTVQVLTIVKALAKQYPQANAGLALAAGYLHDVGKAEEYVEWKNGWGMSYRGRLIGHRNTVIEWIAISLAMNRIAITNECHLSLLHALTCAPNCEWIGVRAPSTPEATLLSLADRLSGEADLVGSLASSSGGWGAEHRHRKSKPFTLPSNEKISAQSKSWSKLLAEF